LKIHVNRSTLFLTELILDLFIFIVCTAVCVGLLIRAHGMSRESSELTRAVYMAQTAAEEFRSGQAMGMVTENDLVVTVDSNTADGLRTAEITVSTRDGTVLYTVTAACAEEVTAP
jgi:hypothetical protein